MVVGKSTKLPPIGPLFPLGGPVPPELIIGRRGEIEEIGQRVREGMSTLLSGPRRIGKNHRVWGGLR